MAHLEKLRARGEAFYERGDIEAALEIYRQLLEAKPGHAELFSDAAAVYFAAGLHDKSRRYCLRALEIDPDCRTARQNLERICIASGTSAGSPAARTSARSEPTSAGKLEEVFENGRYAEAHALAAQWVEDEPQNPEAWNDAAVTAHMVGKTTQAIGYIQQASALAPENRTIQENIDRIESGSATAPLDSSNSAAAPRGHPRPDRKIRALLLERANPAAFLRNLVAALEQEHSLELQYVTIGPSTTSLPVAWADVVWLEWCDEVTAALTRQLDALRSIPTICRLHRFEAFTQMPRKINWQAIDCLVFVAEHVRRAFSRRFPEIEVREEVVPNGVDVERFTVPSCKEEAVDIAFLAHLNYRKNLPLLFQIAAGIRAAGNERVIHVGGDWQRPELEDYFRHMRREMNLRGALVHDGYVEDVPAWLSDKRLLLSTSLNEGHPYNVLEGMAAGLKPVVHNFPGATEVLPEKWVYDTVQQAVERLTGDHGDPYEYREWVRCHYGRDKQVERVCELLSDVSSGKPQENQSRNLSPKARSSESESPLSRTYDIKWYEERTPYRPIYHAFARAIEQVFAPEGLLDLGCGAGYLLEHFADRIPTLGVEGSSAAFEVMSPKAARNSLLADLTQAPPAEIRRYPFLTCIEVAEHIPEEELDHFLAWFAHAEQVLLTAAPPGQGGRNHVTERPPAYWKQRFRPLGFAFCRQRTDEWQAMARAFTRGCRWVVRNAMVFRKEVSPDPNGPEGDGGLAER